MSEAIYNLELERVVEEIRSKDAKKVLIQLAEGLKPNAKEIQEAIIQKLGDKCEIYFWLNSCYGKCDIPDVIESRTNEFDLLIQFGH